MSKALKASTAARNMFETPETAQNHRVAIIYPYIAHYREPIFLMLSAGDASRIEYVVFSDKRSNLGSIVVVDPAKAQLPAGRGGINWRFLRNRWITKELLWQDQVLSLAFGREFDTIIFMGTVYYISTWLGAVFAKIKGKRVIMWTHGVRSNERGLKKLVRITFYRLAHALLLYGPHARNILIENGLQAGRLHLVYNSLDYELQCEVRASITDARRAEERSKLFRNPNLPMIITASRLDGRKQIELLILAAANLSRRRRPVNVLVVGDGPSRPQLETLADAQGLSENIVFFGPCYEEHKLGPLMSAADICVTPGAIGLTAMHAMVYGTPVITHDNPAKQGPEFEAIIPGMTGVFFKYGDTDDLAARIIGWLETHPDRKAVRLACEKIIAAHYTPCAQKAVFDRAVAGLPATEHLEI